MLVEIMEEGKIRWNREVVDNAKRWLEVGTIVGEVRDDDDDDDDGGGGGEEDGAAGDDGGGEGEEECWAWQAYTHDGDNDDDDDDGGGS